MAKARSSRPTNTANPHAQAQSHSGPVKARWRNVLIITGGMTPAVVTETLYALATRADPFVPERIICVVTQGVRRLYDDKLMKTDGPLARLAREYGIPDFWDVIDVQVPYYAEDDPDPALREKPIADIRSDRDAVAFANLVSAWVWRETENPATRVHVSLAGGRKTMSYHGGAALQLFGRPQDELSHVLVHPREYELCNDFWFPTRSDLEVVTRGEQKKKLNAKDARIELALIPFLSVRDFIPRWTRAGNLNYADWVARTKAVLERTARLELIPAEKRVRIGNLADFTLNAVEFAIYQLMAEWAKDEVPGAGPGGIGTQHKGWLTYEMLANPEYLRPNPIKRLIDIHQGVGGGTINDLTDFPANATQRRGNKKWFSPHLSDLRKAIAAQLRHPQLHERFGAPMDTSKKDQKFGLNLLPHEIEIRPLVPR